jgi:hypothetical protein
VTVPFKVYITEQRYQPLPTEVAVAEVISPLAVVAGAYTPAVWVNVIVEVALLAPTDTTINKKDGAVDAFT